MTTRFPHLAVHIFRIGMSLFAHVVALHSGRRLAAHVAAAAVFYAAFALAHDLTHGTLGLSVRARRWALAAAAQLLFVSGQTMRILHLRHHARPGAADDVEGVAIRLGLIGAWIRLPVLFFSMRHAAYQAAKPAARRWLIGETVLTAIVVATSLVWEPLRTYVVVALALQLSAPLWGGYLPHRAPEWLRSLAGRFAFTRSPTAISLAYHDLHHEHADVPCQNLGAFALELGLKGLGMIPAPALSTAVDSYRRRLHT